VRLAFHRGLKRLLLEAFSSHATAPEQVARKLEKVVCRPVARQDGVELREWLARRRINRLVHFTPLGNVQAIHQYGLIPREHLQHEVLRLALGPSFTDDYRWEGMPHFSCLSVTSPNYPMFYSKRQTRQNTRWAVLEFNPEVLSRFWFEFCPTNAASGVRPLNGVAGGEELFLLPDLRQRLCIVSNEPTDPQAEALCDSIIGPEQIMAINVERPEDAAWLACEGISARVNATLFQARHDYAFWKGRRITDLLD
jgi:hypothetical protein